MRIPRADSDPVGAALAASWVTVGWSTSTGTASAIIGLVTGSLSLAGLGITVLIDVVSSAVLIWRFAIQRNDRSVERAERIAHRIASSALVGFGVVLAAESVRRLAARSHGEQSVAAIALAGASVLVLPALARWKYEVAAAVASRALHADAHITAVGAAMAGVTLSGLVVAGVWGWWWADSGAAIVLAAIAIRHGVDGLRYVAA